MSAPKESLGTRIVRKYRPIMNKLTPKQRNELYKEGMRTITKKPKTIKARRMHEAYKDGEPYEYLGPVLGDITRVWEYACDAHPTPERVTKARADGHSVKPVAVIDVSDEDALVEQVAKALFANRVDDREWEDNDCKYIRNQCIGDAVSILLSLNLLKKRRERK